jgi:peptidoglycan-associated lipoprotein
MRTITVLALSLACTLGCSKDKKKTTPTPPADKPVAKEKPAAELKENEPVSASVSVSKDIATACEIKPSSAASPKFDYDQDELTEDDRAVLKVLATCLSTGALKGKNVLMIGRADPRGTEEYNLGLGSRRATSVSGYLVRLGVDKAQIEVTTRGAIEASGTDEAGWKQDRRVDVQLAN